MRPATPVAVPLIVNQDDIRGLLSEVFDQSSALTRKVNLQPSRCLGIYGFVQQRPTNYSPYPKRILARNPCPLKRPHHRMTDDRGGAQHQYPRMRPEPCNLILDLPDVDACIEPHACFREHGQNDKHCSDGKPT